MKRFQSFSVFLDKIADVARPLQSSLSSLLPVSGGRSSLASNHLVRLVVQVDDDCGIIGKQANVDFTFHSGDAVVFYSKLKESIRFYSKWHYLYTLFLNRVHRTGCARGGTSSLFS